MSNDRGHHIEITEDVMDYLPVELSNLLKESYLHSENLDSSSIDNAIFGTGKFYKEKQDDKKEDIYSDIDEMLSSTLDTGDDK